MPLQLYRIPPLAEGNLETDRQDHGKKTAPHKSKAQRSKSPLPSRRSKEKPSSSPSRRNREEKPSPRHRHSSSLNPSTETPRKHRPPATAAQKGPREPDDNTPFSITNYIQDHVHTAVRKIPGIRWLTDSATNPINVARAKLSHLDDAIASASRRNTSDGSWLYPKVERAGNHQNGASREIDIDSLKRSTRKKKVKKTTRRKQRHQASSSSSASLSSSSASSASSASALHVSRDDLRAMYVDAGRKPVCTFTFDGSPADATKTLFTIEDVGGGGRAPKRYRPKNLVNITPNFNFKQAAQASWSELPTRKEFRFTPKLLRYDSGGASGTTVCNVASTFDFGRSSARDRPAEENDARLLTPDEGRQVYQRRERTQHHEVQKISSPMKNARDFFDSFLDEAKTERTAVNMKSDVNFLGVDRDEPLPSSEEAITGRRRQRNKGGGLNFAWNNQEDFATRLANDTTVRPLPDEHVYESECLVETEETAHGGLNDFSGENFLSMPKYVQVLPCGVGTNSMVPYFPDWQHSCDRTLPKPCMDDEFQGLFRAALTKRHVSGNDVVRSETKRHVPAKDFVGPKTEGHLPVNDSVRPKTEGRVPVNDFVRPETKRHVPVSDFVRPKTKQDVPFNDLARPKTEEHVPVNEFVTRVSERHVPPTFGRRILDVVDDVETPVDVDLELTTFPVLPVFLLPSQRLMGRAETDVNTSSKRRSVPCNIYQFTRDSPLQLHGRDELKLDGRNAKQAEAASVDRNGSENKAGHEKGMRIVLERNVANNWTYDIKHEDTDDEVEVNSWKLTANSQLGDNIEWMESDFATKCEVVLQLKEETSDRKEAVETDDESAKTCSDTGKIETDHEDSKEDHLKRRDKNDLGARLEKLCSDVEKFDTDLDELDDEMLHATPINSDDCPKIRTYACQADEPAPPTTDAKASVAASAAPRRKRRSFLRDNMMTPSTMLQKENYRWQPQDEPQAQRADDESGTRLADAGVPATAQRKRNMLYEAIVKRRATQRYADRPKGLAGNSTDNSSRADDSSSCSPRPATPAALSVEKLSRHAIEASLKKRHKTERSLKNSTDTSSRADDSSSCSPRQVAIAAPSIEKLKKHASKASMKQRQKTKRSLKNSTDNSSRADDSSSSSLHQAANAASSVEKLKKHSSETSMKKRHKTKRSLDSADISSKADASSSCSLRQVAHAAPSVDKLSKDTSVGSITQRQKISLENNTSSRTDNSLGSGRHQVAHVVCPVEKLNKHTSVASLKQRQEISLENDISSATDNSLSCSPNQVLHSALPVVKVSKYTSVDSLTQRPASKLDSTHARSNEEQSRVNGRQMAKLDLAVVSVLAIPGAFDKTDDDDALVAERTSITGGVLVVEHEDTDGDVSQFDDVQQREVVLAFCRLMSDYDASTSCGDPESDVVYEMDRSENESNISGTECQNVDSKNEKQSLFKRLLIPSFLQKRTSQQGPNNHATEANAGLKRSMHTPSYLTDFRARVSSEGKSAGTTSKWYHRFYPGRRTSKAAPSQERLGSGERCLPTDFTQALPGMLLGSSMPRNRGRGFRQEYDFESRGFVIDVSPFREC